MPDDLAREHMLLKLIGLLDRLQHVQLLTRLGGGADQRLHVLGKAGSAIAAAGIEKVVADTGIRTDALAHQFNIRAQSLGEVGQFVHERDARRQHGIRRILGQLGRAQIHHDHPLMVALEWRIELTHEFHRLRILGTDDDAIRLHEIFDRRPFLEELGVGNDAVGNVGATCL